MDYERGSPRMHLRDDGYARSELKITVLSRLKDDFYGDPLHDFDVIACGIFRRKQAEKWTGRSGDAVDVALVATSIGIRVENHRLTGPDVPKLRLFEISRDPHVLERNQCQQLLAGLNIHSNDHRLSHLTGHRGNNFCVVKVQLRLLESRALLLDRGFGRDCPGTSCSQLFRRRLCGAVTCMS